jgi:hypothetical protein
MCSLCCGDNFMVIMIFTVDVVNTKVVDNYLIFLVLNFHDLKLDSLGVT